MFKFTNIHKVLLRITYGRICLLLLLISFFLLLTIFLGAVLMLECQWSILWVSIICLSPWLLGILVTLIKLTIYQAEYRQEKADLASYGRNAILSRIVLLVIQYFVNKKEKHNHN